MLVVSSIATGAPLSTINSNGGTFQPLDFPNAKSSGTGGITFDDAASFLLSMLLPGTQYVLEYDLYALHDSPRVTIADGDEDLVDAGVLTIGVTSLPFTTPHSTGELKLLIHGDADQAGFNYIRIVQVPVDVQITIPDRTTDVTGYRGTANVVVAGNSISKVVIEAIDYDGDPIDSMRIEGTDAGEFVMDYATAERIYAHQVRVTVTAAGNDTTETQVVNCFKDIPHMLTCSGGGFTSDQTKTAPGIRRYKSSHLADFKKAGIGHLRLRMVEDIYEGNWNIEQTFDTTDPDDENSGKEKKDVPFKTHVLRVVEDCLRHNIIPILAFDPQNAEDETDFDKAQTLLDGYYDQWAALHKIMPSSNILAYNPFIEIGHYQGKTADRRAQTVAWYKKFRDHVRDRDEERVIFYGSPNLSDPTHLDDLKFEPSTDKWLGTEWHAFAAGTKIWTPATEAEKNDPAIYTELDASVEWTANTAYTAGQLIHFAIPENAKFGIMEEGQTVIVKAPAAMTSGAALNADETERYEAYGAYSQHGFKIDSDHIKFWIPDDHQLVDDEHVTETQVQRANDLIRQKFSQAKHELDLFDPKRQGYFGAVLVSNAVKSERWTAEQSKGDMTAVEQAAFVEQFMQTGADYGSPAIAWNSDDRFYNREEDKWRPEMEDVLDAVVKEYTPNPANVFDLSGTDRAIETVDILDGVIGTLSEDERDWEFTVAANQTIEISLSKMEMYREYTLAGKMQSYPAGAKMTVSIGDAGAEITDSTNFAVDGYVTRPASEKVTLTFDTAGTYKLRNLKVR